MYPREKRPTKILFRISEPLAKKIAKFKDLTLLPNNQTLGLDELLASYSKLNTALEDPKLSGSKKLTLEKYKLAHMQSILVHLIQFDTLSKLQKRKDDKKKPGRFKKLIYGLKDALLIIVSTIGMVEASTFDFLGTQMLLKELAPAISYSMMMLGSTLLTGISCLIFFAFEINLLMNFFGIHFNNSNKQTMACHDQQIWTATLINEQLRTPTTARQINTNDYRQLKNAAHVFNTDLEAKMPSYEKHKTSWVMKGLQGFFTVVGGILTALGSYFGASSFLGVVAASLVGTPIGWAIAGSLVFAGLFFYFAMGGDGLTNLFNPSKEKFQQVQGNLKAFVGRKRSSELDQSLLYRSKQNPTYMKTATKPSPGIEALNLEGYKTAKSKFKNNSLFSKPEPKANNKTEKTKQKPRSYSLG